MGIDTSNYTTSVAVVDENGCLLGEERQLLTVKSGNRGLRQSEAFYQHCFNLPVILEKLANSMPAIDLADISAIGVSTRPRNIEGSYMPVFKCGENFARFTGTTLKVPVFEFSHQEGHVKAITSFNKVGEKFITFHLSGGTNEVLKIQANPYNNCENQREMGIEIIGRTLDISMGQLIDRVGVLMELPFPAGPYMDQLALDFKEKIEKEDAKGTLHVKPIPVKGLDINVSGIETQLSRKVGEFSKEEIAATAFKSIVKALEKQVKLCQEQYPGWPIVFAGGVAKSQYIRDYFKDQVIFGQYSSDNAVGTALLCRDEYLKRENYGY